MPASKRSRLPSSRIRNEPLSFFSDRAVVGDDGDALLRIAAVVDEDAGEHAAGLPLANADGQVLVELGEAAGLQDVGQHVGGDFGIPLLEAAHAVGREIGGDEGNQERHHEVA